jgi:alpha-L-fucosidase
MVSALYTIIVLLAFSSGAANSVPLPNPRQLEFMDLELTQFMHFGIPTFWDPPKEYLYGKNPTYHDCSTTNIDHGPQTKDYYPCLNPNVFNPTDLNAEDWMEASSAMGMREIIITAHHEGGFALWPSNFTNYSVAASSWKGGKGDVLREFTDAANKWGIKISYYLSVQNDGYMVYVAKYGGDEFIRRQIGMVKEVLTNYGPVNRFWFDGTKRVPDGTDVDKLWQQTYDTIRTVSPDTMISSYRGDICASTGTLYTNDGPAPNSTNASKCGTFSETGKYFHPTEMHGITIQEGPDGNSDAVPTYW